MSIPHCKCSSASLNPLRCAVKFLQIPVNLCDPSSFNHSDRGSSSDQDSGVVNSGTTWGRQGTLGLDPPSLHNSASKIRAVRQAAADLRTAKALRRHGGN